MVVHLIDDISYDAKLNRYIKFAILGLNRKNMFKNAKNDKIFLASIFFIFSDKYSTVVVHTLNKDISYETKRHKSKIYHFEVNYSNSLLKCFNFI